MCELKHIHVLDVTCDNASNNDVMVEKLSTLLPDFPGAANRTRCFTHILNLVAKAILKQFDAPKGSATDAAALEALAEDLAQLEVDENDEELDDDELLSGEEIPTGREGLSADEVVELEESLKPVRMVLAKVRHPYALTL